MTPSGTNMTVADDNVFQVAPISLLDDRETIGEGPKWANMERGLVKFEKLHSEVAFPKTVTETIFASGGQTLIRKDRYLELDGLDDLYDPFYWEDVDLSYRAWNTRQSVVICINTIAGHSFT